MADRFLTGACVLLLALVVAAVGWVTWRQWRAPSGSGAGKLVTVDLVRILNAERKALPKLSDGGDPSLELLRIGRQIRPTIRKVAGPDTVVLVKQSVVGGHLPDITDRVLKYLGLPAKAPTVNLTGALDDAPTTASLTAGQVWADHLKKMQAQAQAQRRKEQGDALDRKLP